MTTQSGRMKWPILWYKMGRAYMAESHIRDKITTSYVLLQIADKR